jgi:hypothetical protein
LLKYAIHLAKLYKNSMAHWQQCLTLGTLEVLECCTHELSYKFLHDLHLGQVNNEQAYICVCVCVCIMSKFATSGGLWGDFTYVY